MIAVDSELVVRSCPDLGCKRQKTGRCALTRRRQPSRCLGCGCRRGAAAGGGGRRWEVQAREGRRASIISLRLFTHHDEPFSFGGGDQGVAAIRKSLERGCASTGTLVVICSVVDGGGESSRQCLCRCMHHHFCDMCTHATLLWTVTNVRIFESFFPMAMCTQKNETSRGFKSFSFIVPVGA